MEEELKLPEELKRYRLAISGRGYKYTILGISLLLVGLIYGNLLAITLGYLILFLIILDLRKVLLLNIGNLKVLRKMDRKTLFIDNYTYVEVEIQNKSDKPIESIEVEDLFPHGLEWSYGIYKAKLSLKRRDKVVFGYILKAVEKGGFRVGPMRIIYESPLKLFYMERYIPKFDNVIVFPAVDRVEKMYYLSKSMKSTKIFGIHRGRRVGSGTDFYGIREYTRYDDYRAIDWKASVRTMKLMVKEFTEEIPLNIMVMLDSGYSMGYGTPITKFSYAVDTALLLSRLAIDNRDKVGLLVFSDAVNAYIPPRSSQSNIDLMLRELALIEPGGGKSYTKAVQYFVEKYRLSSLIVFISDLEGDLEDLMEAIRLARLYNHRVFVLYFYTPYFEEEDVGEEGDLKAQVAKSIVFDRLLETRKMLINNIIKVGGHVIVVSPKYLLPLLLERYFKAVRRR